MSDDLKVIDRLLRLYPRHLRALHQEDLRGFLRAQRAEPRYRTRLGALLFVLHVSGDAVRARIGATLPQHDDPRIGRLGRTHALTLAEDLVQELSYAARSLVRSPVFASVAVLTMMLGIGANTAMFSIVNAVLLEPLDYPEPERLVYLTTLTSDEVDASWVSPAEYLELRRLARPFITVGAYAEGEVDLAGGDRPRRVRAAGVDAALLETLGVQPALGRPFLPEEAEGNPLGQRAPFAILSYELWQSEFGGRPMVGNTVTISGIPREVVGIMPPGASIMDHRTEVWVPLGIDPSNPGDRASHGIQVVGRLGTGISQEAAERELSRLTENWAQLAGLQPGDHVFEPARDGRGHALRMIQLQQIVVGDAARAIWVLQGAVSLVLLIACANLANLQLARAERRHHESAIRAALGAGRGRLFRQFVFEGLLLSLTGGALGALLARAGVRALTLAYPDSLPRSTEVSAGGLVLVFTLAVGVATGVLFGVVPVVQTRSRSLLAALKAGGSRTAGRGGRRRLSQGLVLAEVALSVLLVTSAGLLVRTVLNLTRVDAGIDPSHLVTFSARFAGGAYPESALRVEAWQRLLAELRRIPGVESATATSGVPLERSPTSNNTDIESYTPPEGGNEYVDFDQAVLSDYFETMGIPIVEGRGFQLTDRASEGIVVVVNQAMARKFWPGRSPIGQRLRRPYASDAWYTVVGVAGDVKQQGFAVEAGTELFFFAEQPVQHGRVENNMNVVLRTTLPADALSGTLERVMRGVDPAVPVVRLREMEDVFTGSISRERLMANLIGGFAALALLLAALGTYGVFAHLVEERRREMGIRLALGAVPAGVLAMVLRQGIGLTVVGLALGVAGAMGLDRLIASFLFGVEPMDLLTLVVVTVTILVVAAVACGIPAWRAARVDPRVVLLEG
jgi:putative ABC transport system permease protein